MPQYFLARLEYKFWYRSADVIGASAHTSLKPSLLLRTVGPQTTLPQHLDVMKYSLVRTSNKIRVNLSEFQASFHRLLCPVQKVEDT